MTSFETMLLGAIGTGLTGAGGLILWIVKSVIPRVLLSFEERNKVLVASAEKTAEGVAKIPEAIKSFELALVSVENRIVDRLRDSGEKIISKIEDKRYDELQEEIRASRNPPKASPKQ